MRIEISKPSYWISNTPVPDYPRLMRDLDVEVAIIGAGITGITCAYLLKKAGRKVVLLEGGRCASAESGHTSAHLTYVYDTRLSKLEQRYSLDQARLVWDSLALGLNLIETIVNEEQIDCSYALVPGYLYSVDSKGRQLLEKELELIQKIGYDATHVPESLIPFASNYVLRFEQQARFHPRQYLAALLPEIHGDHAEVYANTLVTSITSGKRPEIKTEGGPVVTCDQLIVAGHVPFDNRGLIHTKQAAYRTYVLAFTVPKGLIPDALYWDTLNPYHYTRLHPGLNSDLLIIGGEDHKTGQEQDTNVHYQALRRYAKTELGITAEPSAQWSGQIIESVDKLPYIGLSAGNFHSNEYVASGFSGDGLTFGSFAGFILSERVMGRVTAFDKLYDPARVPRKSTKEFVTENIDYPAYFLKDFFRQSDAASEDDVQPGEGKIVRIRGRQVGVYRDHAGLLHGVSLICPHLGCHVHWNAAEESWDCPCHGSRFTATGELCNGPAQSGLKKVILGPHSESAAEPFHVPGLSPSPLPEQP